MQEDYITEIFPSLKKNPKPKGVDWNAFRRLQPSLTFKQREKIGDYLDELYPIQRYFHAIHFKKMFEKLPEDLSVVELGCHQGNLAKKMLKEFSKIKSWTGYDFHSPISRSIVHDDRYSSMILSDWFQNISLPDFDVFVSSHTLEHLSNKEAAAVLCRIQSPYMLIEVPLNKEGRNWHNWGCTHTLLWGLDKLYNFITNLGYSMFYKSPAGHVSGWKLVSM
jgi:hypothetical protein